MKIDVPDIDELSADDKRALLRELLGKAIGSGATVPTATVPTEMVPGETEPAKTERAKSNHSEVDQKPQSSRRRVRFPGPLFRRSDGVLIRDESPVRLIMPFLMKRRSECLSYYRANYDITRTMQWISAYNASDPPQRVTLFDIFLWACARAAHSRPGMNRFVSGGRLYQRKRVQISFVAKESLEMNAPLVTVKVDFPERGESLDSTVARIAEAIETGREGSRQHDDPLVKLALMLPAPLTQLGVWCYRMLDRMNLMPAGQIDSDPFYTTVFVANLGSVGLESSYHHLYEHGTCSVFATLGARKQMPTVNRDGGIEVKDSVGVGWTIDTRIIDGLYNAFSLHVVQSLVENPSAFIGPPESAARGTLSDSNDDSGKQGSLTGGNADRLR